MKDKLTTNSLSLITILLLALIIRIGFAIAFPNILWPDEIFQTLEQGHRLAFNYGIIPWEFRDGIRSWVFPAIIGGIMKMTGWMGEGSGSYIMSVRVFLCLLSLIPIGVGFGIGYQIGGRSTAIITAGVCAIWYELIYFAPKAFSEVVAAYVFLAAVYLGFYHQLMQHRTRFLLTGCLLGLTIILRIHLILGVAFVVYWLVKKEGQNSLSPLLWGMLILLLMAGILDAFTWSYPFQSFWKNVWVNVVEGKAEMWGVSPWYDYLKMLLSSWSIAVIPIAFFAVIGTRQSPILAILSLIIIISHSAIGHKEFRFIYPAIPMIIILVGLGTSKVFHQVRWRQLSLSNNVRIILIPLLLWLFISIILGRVYDVSKSFNSSRLWSKSEGSLWGKNSDKIKSFEYLSKEKTLCGVAIESIDWWDTAGYAYLHQDVPIFMIGNEAQFKELAPSFNVLLSPNESFSKLNYTSQKCWGDLCVYKRLGSCSPVENYHINKYI